MYQLKIFQKLCVINQSIQHTLFDKKRKQGVVVKLYLHFNANQIKVLSEDIYKG